MNDLIVTQDEYGLLKPTKIWTYSQVQAAGRALEEDAQNRFDALNAYHELKNLVLHIDYMAIYKPIADRAAALEGYDEKLTAAYTKLIGKARLVNISFVDVFPETTKLVGQRVDAIQRAPKDGGERLLEVIAGVPGYIGSQATAVIEKIRQGEGVMPVTRRVHDLAEQQRKITPAWIDTAFAILDDLSNRESELDETDAALLAELRFRRSKSTHDLKEYVKSTYHGYRRSREFRRKQRQA